MFYVHCQGRGPWPSRAARTVARCEPIGAGRRPNTGARGSQAKRRSSRTGGSGRARWPAATSTPTRIWSRCGGSSWPRGTAPSLDTCPRGFFAPGALHDRPRAQKILGDKNAAREKPGGHVPEKILWVFLSKPSFKTVVNHWISATNVHRASNKCPTVEI